MKPGIYVSNLLIIMRRPVFLETKFQITAVNIQQQGDTGIPETNPGTYCEE